MKNRMICGCLLLVSTLLLTGCPLDWTRYNYYNTTEQGSIYALSMQNNEFGVSLKSAVTEIQILGESTLTPTGSLLDSKARVNQTLEVYNNTLALKKVTFVLPIFQTVLLSSNQKDEIVTTLTCYQDGRTTEIEPEIQYGMLRSLSSIDYVVVSYEGMKKEMEFIDQIPTTLYQYHVHPTSIYNDANLYGFECSSNQESMPFFLLNDVKAEMTTTYNEEKGTYRGSLSFPLAEESYFYSNIDYSSLWEDKESLIEVKEIAYEDLTLKESEAYDIEQNVLKSHLAMRLYQNQTNPYAFYFSSLKTLFDDVLLQNYFLVYKDVPLLGNNQITRLQCSYPTRIEKEIIQQKENYLISYVYDGLSNFTRIDHHQCSITFNEENDNSYSVSHKSGMFEVKKESSTSFQVEMEDNAYRKTAYLGFKKENKNQSSCSHSCNQGLWSVKYFFGIIFIFIYLLIELPYRRKKQVK